MDCNNCETEKKIIKDQIIILSVVAAAGGILSTVGLSLIAWRLNNKNCE